MFGAWGPRKAEAMRRLAQAYGYDLASSYAYADSISDADMLKLVGNAIVVHPDDELRAMAELNGWPELDFEVVSVRSSACAEDDEPIIWPFSSGGSTST